MLFPIVITEPTGRPIISKNASVTGRHNRPLFLFHLPRYSFYSLRIQERIFQVASTGLVEEVSIASSQTGYKAYCRFGFLMPQFDEHPSPDEWLQRGRIDPRTITAYRG